MPQQANESNQLMNESKPTSRGGPKLSDTCFTNGKKWINCGEKENLKLYINLHQEGCSEYAVQNFEPGQKFTTSIKKAASYNLPLFYS